jgi:hypothetical protein
MRLYDMLPTVIEYAQRALANKRAGTRVLITTMYDFTQRRRRFVYQFVDPPEIRITMNGLPVELSDW